jgi:hypothetical protein
MIELQPVFIAATVAETDVVEKLLDAEGIEYDVSPEPHVNEMSGEACLMGVMFRVSTAKAHYCCQLLRERGLGRGVIEPLP